MTQTLSWKLVIDSADPHAQAEFWAEALGYVVEDNSPLIERLLSAGAVPEAATTHAHGRRAWRDLAAARHPDDPYDEVSGTGHGRRLLFQRVPEPKTGKNRLHIDVHSAPGRRDAEAERLVALGAQEGRTFDEQGGSWVVMTDPDTPDYQF
ncbi:VOC family protein [Streptomyces californicus]|uniref:VOC family protein n=1 Tax=Streptomyces californicus TaxID=67351 RepID=UPI00380B9EF7